MAFDVTNPVHLLALQTEYLTDPAGLGYAAANGATDVILDLFNNEENNPGSETGVPPLTIGELWSIVASDSATATQFEFNINNLFCMAGGSGPDTDISDYRNGVLSLNDNQVNNLINARSRHLNRVEVLFGGTEPNGNAEVITISQSEWFAAREYQG